MLCLALSLAFMLNTRGEIAITDSLEQILNKTTDKKERLEILVKLSKEFAFVSFDKSLKYGDQAIGLAKGQKNKEKEAEAYLYLGDAYSYQNIFDDAYQNYKKANVLAQVGGFNEISAISLNSIGLNYYYQGKLDDALVSYNQSFIFAKKNGVKKEEGNALFNIGQVYRKRNNIDTATYFYYQALKSFEAIKDANGLAKTNNSLGLIHSESGDYKKATEFYNTALKYRELTGDKKGCAILYNNIGNVSYSWGKYEKAIDDYQKALKIFEVIGSREGIARCANNIGLVYENLARGDNYKQNIGYYRKALEYHEKAFIIWEGLGEEYEMAKSYNNIGNVNAKEVYEKLIAKYGTNWENTIDYKEKILVKNEYLKTIEYYRKSLTLREKIKDKPGIASSLSNLGKIYNYTGNYSQALSYLERALKMNEALDNKNEVAYNILEIGRIYYNLKSYNKALDYFNRSLSLAQRNDLTKVEREAYSSLSNIYYATGDYQQSLNTYKRFVEIQDSFLNENNMKQIAEIQTQYETEKKEQQIQLLNKDAKLKDVQRKTTILLAIGGLLFLSVIIVVLIRQNKQRQNTNNELAAKNQLITEQKTEITDSIHYAKRIQSAVMPVESHVRQLLPDSFVYFKPRDIVSGDFYWMSEKSGKVIVAAADCTGHGVPGAFMSMLGTALMSNIVAEADEIHSEDILNGLRHHIINSLHQTGKEGENKDGMDLALYILDPANLTLEFSGANNPLYVVRNGELIETKADRMPIGIHERVGIPFTRNNIELKKGDMVYTFSDGYHDQFGGPSNKKFMSANLKRLFVQIANEMVDKQSEILDKTITDWMRDTYQVDDMLVIGVRV
jgi:tetratricopeptide (TPR) repeat protein